MRIHKSIRKHQWSFYIIPSIHLYIEHRSPYVKFIGKPGGLFLTFLWMKWEVTIGLYQEI